MLIRVSDPTLVPRLSAISNSGRITLVKQVGDDAVAVSVLGSFADGGELDLTLYFVAWQAAHPEATFDLLEHL